MEEASASEGGSCGEEGQSVSSGCPAPRVSDSYATDENGLAGFAVHSVRPPSLVPSFGAPDLKSNGNKEKGGHVGRPECD